jgi:hypothetical protein
MRNHSTSRRRSECSPPTMRLTTDPHLHSDSPWRRLPPTSCSIRCRCQTSDNR